MFDPEAPEIFDFLVCHKQAVSTPTLPITQYIKCDLRFCLFVYMYHILDGMGYRQYAYGAMVIVPSIPTFHFES